LKTFLKPVESDEDNGTVDEDGCTHAGGEHYGDLLVQCQLVEIDAAIELVTIYQIEAEILRIQTTLSGGAACKEKSVDVCYIRAFAV
jgi:hypothetical protein